jgi:hypothetical protein
MAFPITAGDACDIKLPISTENAYLLGPRTRVNASEAGHIFAISEGIE